MRRAAFLIAALIAFAAGPAAAQSFWAVRTNDAYRTAAWYQAHLDLVPDPAIRPEGTNLTILILRGPTATVEIVGDPSATPAPSPATGLFKGGFTVPDLDAALARWRAAGVTVVAGPFDDPAGRMAVIRDGDGVTLQVIETPAR